MREITVDELADSTDRPFIDRMRSDVPARYPMVKGLRTEHEVNNPNAVIDGFIAAGIRWRKRKGDD